MKVYVAIVNDGEDHDILGTYSTMAQAKKVIKEVKSHIQK